MTFPIFRPRWQQEILHPVKSGFMVRLSLLEQSPITQSQRDTSSAATCVLKWSSGAQESICTVPTSVGFLMWCFYLGYLFFQWYLQTWCLIMQPFHPFHMCKHISIVCWVLLNVSEENLFTVLFSVGSNFIIRPQSSLNPSRCGRQRCVAYTRQQVN